MSFCVGLAQIQPQLGCVQKNFDIIERYVQHGIRQQADLIVFPELAVSGYFLKDLVTEVGLSIDSPLIDRLKQLSHDISIVIGLVEYSSSYQYFNSAIYFENGEIRHIHRKVYLPTYGLFDEQRYLASGDRFRAFDTKFGRMGMLICEDMWHLSASYILIQDGVDTIICLSSSPGKGISHQKELDSTVSWQKLTSTIAQFFTCRVLFCNRVGYEDGVVFWGGSEAVHPSGEVLVRAKTYEEDCIWALLENNVLRRERLVVPIMRDEKFCITLNELRRIKRTRWAP